MKKEYSNMNEEELDDRFYAERSKIRNGKIKWRAGAVITAIGAGLLLIGLPKYIEDPSFAFKYLSVCGSAMIGSGAYHIVDGITKVCKGASRIEKIQAEFNKFYDNKDEYESDDDEIEV